MDESQHAEDGKAEKQKCLGPRLPTVVLDHLPLNLSLCGEAHLIKSLKFSFLLLIAKHFTDT